MHWWWCEANAWGLGATAATAAPAGGAAGWGPAAAASLVYRFHVVWCVLGRARCAGMYSAGCTAAACDQAEELLGGFFSVLCYRAWCAAGATVLTRWHLLLAVGQPSPHHALFARLPGQALSVSGYELHCQGIYAWAQMCAAPCSCDFVLQHKSTGWLAPRQLHSCYPPGWVCYISLHILSWRLAVASAAATFGSYPAGHCSWVRYLCMLTCEVP